MDEHQPPGAIKEASEPPEQIVGRIRDRYRAAAAAKASGDARKAEQLNQAGDDLLDRLAEGWLEYVDQTACRMMGPEHELFVEAVSLTFFKLTKEIRAIERDTNFERSFLPCLMRILADVKVELFRKFVERDGGSKVVTTTDGKPLKLSFQDGDATRTTLEGTEATILDRIVDEEARYSFVEIIGEDAVSYGLKKMSERQAEIFKLAMGGMSFVKIGEKLGINRETASAEYARAEQTLKNTLARERAENP